MNYSSKSFNIKGLGTCSSLDALVQWNTEEFELRISKRYTLFIGTDTLWLPPIPKSQKKRKKKNWDWKKFKWNDEVSQNYCLGIGSAY